MKKYLLIAAIFFLCLPLGLADTLDWRIVKSTHFIVYYKNAPEDFIEDLIRRAEDYYSEIAEDLGFRRYNFWLWDNRAKIYIHDDAKSYQDVTKQPSWSSGSANVKDKIIHTFPYAKGFFDTILPHEMGHIIFREFVGFDNCALPLWLDEGVASYQENLRNPVVGRTVRQAMAENKFIKLEELSRMSQQSLEDSNLVGLFYAEAVSVIDYLVKEFGKDRFVQFCKNLRDKKNLEESLASAYRFKNIQELDQAWQKYLER